MQVILRHTTEIPVDRMKTRVIPAMAHSKLIKVVHKRLPIILTPPLLTDSNSHTMKQHTATKDTLQPCTLLLLQMMCILRLTRDIVCQIGNLTEVCRCLSLLIILMHIRHLRLDMKHPIHHPTTSQFVLHQALLGSAIPAILVRCLVSFIQLRLPTNTFRKPIVRPYIATTIARSAVDLTECH